MKLYVQGTEDGHSQAQSVDADLLCFFARGGNELTCL